ncbi:macro domain-containing protein [Myxococcota bacterium]
MLVKVVLVDINPKMISAWREAFEEHPEVEIVHGSMLEQQVSAWVSPTNSAGRMDGGLDLVIKNHLGEPIQTALSQEIHQKHHGALPVGFATCVATGRPQPRYLISTPTMISSSEDISDTMNVALACAGAFQAVNMQNMAAPGSIRSVALPGLGANTGRVPVEICADLMWSGFSLFRRRSFETFEEMRKALEAELGDLGPVTGKTQVPKIAIQQPAVSGGNGGFVPGSYGPGVKDDDIDFDDSDDDDFDDDDD